MWCATTSACFSIPSADYDAAVKEICRFGEHFLTYGPNIADRPADFKRQGNPNRFLL